MQYRIVALTKYGKSAGLADWKDCLNQAATRFIKNVSQDTSFFMPIFYIKKFSFPIIKGTSIMWLHKFALT